MRYKRMERAGVDMSTITIGTWAMSNKEYGAASRKDCIAAIGEMVDRGVNHIDTAWVYGLGECDKIVGEALRELQIPRDKVLITTKCGFRNHPGEPTKPNYPDCSPEWITKQFEDSLRNMGIDYVDFFLVHVADRNVPFEVTAECVNKWVEQGKIRFTGVSNYNVPDLQEMEKYLPITANQCGYSMVNRGNEENMKWCVENGIAIETHSSLANGILTGAIRELPKYADDDIRTLYGMPWFKEPMFSKIMNMLKEFDKIAAERNVPVAQIVLNWSMQKDFITSALCGVRNVKEASENCASTEWELTEEEIKLIDDAIKDNLG